MIQVSFTFLFFTFKIRVNIIFLLIDTHYQDPHLNYILRWYTENLDESSLLIPVGGIKALDSLLSMSNNKMLLLSGDKVNKNM